MKYAYLLTIAAAATLTGCPTPTPSPSPTPTPTPISTGGSFATGGSASTGGSPAATGGSKPCATTVWPSAMITLPKTAKVVQHKFIERHFRPQGRAMSAIAYYGAAAVQCDCAHFPNSTTPLNQGNYGACTGCASDGVISSAPFVGFPHFNLTTALQIYQGGSCVDNGCSLPCTCASCSKAFCPSTGANDNGSQGSSVFTYLISQGWLKGFVTADTTADLIAGLAHSECEIGIDYLNSMMNPGSNGQLVVTLSSGVAGGHELAVVGYRSDFKGIVIRNSWGPWGQCYPSQETANTPTTGEGCGYAWIALSDLPTLNFDADCPTF